MHPMCLLRTIRNKVPRPGGRMAIQDRRRDEGEAWGQRCRASIRRRPLSAASGRSAWRSPRSATATLAHALVSGCAPAAGIALSARGSRPHRLRRLARAAAGRRPDGLDPGDAGHHACAAGRVLRSAAPEPHGSDADRPHHRRQRCSRRCWPATTPACGSPRRCSLRSPRPPLPCPSGTSNQRWHEPVRVKVGGAPLPAVSRGPPQRLAA